VFGQSVTLSVESNTVPAGSSVVVPINLTSLGGAQATAIQWTMSYPPDITRVVFAAGPAATNANKTIACNGNMCLIYGMNNNVIPDGAVATATLQISSTPSASTIPIQLTGVVATTQQGGSISAAGVSGTISIPPQPALSGLSCASPTLNTPGSTQCTISLTAPAQAVGFVVQVASNNGSLVVPSSAMVNSGQTTASFAATAAQVNANQAATITAGSGAIAKSVSLNLVAPAPLLTISIASPSSGGSFTTSNSTISLSGSASDTFGVTQVSWVADRATSPTGGGTSGTAAGTSSWAINGLILATGVTHFTVTASDAAGNHASALIALTYASPTPGSIGVQSFSLNDYQRNLDGQWQGIRQASDGQVYFGSSTVSAHHGASFFKYNPATSQVTMLAEDLTILCGEDPYTNPQGSLHSDVVEANGWIYFSTHFSSALPGAYATWTGSHLIGYELATGHLTMASFIPTTIRSRLSVSTRCGIICMYL